MKSLKLILPAILSLMISQSFAQATATNTTKATAQLAASCTLKTNNVSWGSLMLPLTTQTASGNMNVLCNKGASYTVDLAYGGIYGAGSSATGYTMSFNYSNTNSMVYNVYNSVGTLVSSLGLGCGFGGYKGYTYFGSVQVANLYGSNTVGWQVNSKACVGDGTLAGTHPTDWAGAYNAAGSQSIGAAAYTYGIISGVNGGQIAYSIEVPGASNKVWNLGVNSYAATGTGISESIPVRATIIPGRSSSAYPPPDLYSDSLTATITY